ncbi:MAG TPA: trypsin-like peptidase domain-containing protein, partial [Streptosporangiaceae bacterium]|nr:trypsin-like peptidase domain-containing protein [Streptosporangiaceae bacterium]
MDETDTAGGRPRWIRGLLVYLAVALLAAGAGIGATLEVHSLAISSAMASLTAPQERMDSARVYREVAPTVVDISADLHFLDETAEGTGFVIDAHNGLVLTNNHVIDGATSVTVTLALNGKTFPATVLGYDLPADVALLRIDPAGGLTAATLGNSDNLRPGISVLALGNEAGQGGPPSSASGVISGTGRSIVATDHSSNLTETLHNMLQTSADIRPGDSGGPLINAEGQVVGIDTAAGDTGSRQGSGSGSASGSGPGSGSRGSASSGSGSGGDFAGYAIPINAALAIVRQIEAGRPEPDIHLGMPALLGVLLPSSSAHDPHQQAGAGTADHGVGASYSGPGCVSSETVRFGAMPPRIAPAVAGALVDGV